MGCFLKIEKTDRRLSIAGGELVGTGEDGGLDRGASSDHIVGVTFGLEVGRCDDSGDNSQSLTTASFSVVEELVSTVLSAFSTRLRLEDGSSS
jgi:hypothetical protein